ncbi:hypothetical protein PMAYCL1PPCAC_11917, partial [Pristionchus mayeri]
FSCVVQGFLDIGESCLRAIVWLKPMASKDVLVTLLKELNISKKTPPNEAQAAKLLDVLENKTAPFFSRLMAAQFLAGSSSNSTVISIPSIVASLKSRTADELFQIFVTWCVHVEKAGFPSLGDGYEFFYHLLKELSKRTEMLFHQENRDTALFATLYYCEVNPGKDSSKCLPLFLKAFLRSEPDRQEVFGLVLNQVSPGIKSKYDLLAAIIQSDHTVLNADNFHCILYELAEVAKSQEGSSTCVLLLSVIFQTVESVEIIDWFVGVITTTDKCTRNNVHRSWICRLSAIPSLHSALDDTLAKCRSLFVSTLDPIDFPPNGKEVHEWTCIDPYERWEENEDVYWPSDALLSTVLLLVSLRQKGPVDEGLRDLLLRASRWHHEEIRLTSLQLLMRFDNMSKDDKIDLVLRNLFVDEDNFVKELANIKIDSGDGKLEETLTRFAKEGHKVALQSLLRINESQGRLVIGDLLVSIESEERRMAYSIGGGVLRAKEKERIMEILMKMDTVDDRIIDYLNWLSKGNDQEKNIVEQLIVKWGKEGKADWIKCAHLLPSSNLKWIMEMNKERIEELLELSGSSSVEECPSFTQFYENIRLNGMQPKEYSDEMLTRLSLLEVSSRVGGFPTEKAARIVFDTILRCRYKAIVDQGASLFEMLIRREESLARGYGEEILSLLSSSSTQCRSLTLSRTLLSCSLLDSSLIESMESSFLVTYSLPLSNRPSLIRWLKTLKLMTAKANDTKISDSFVEGLFFICIHLQYLSSDFLERSAAMCLYSFCILKMVGPTGCPLFAVIAARPKFALELFNLIHKLPSLPRVVSILIFSFLSKLDYVADNFYGENWTRRLDEARESIWLLLLKTGLKRERRFIVDAFLSLTPHADREELKEQFEYDREEDELQYLKGSLIARDLPSGEVVESRLECSLYWRKVKESLEKESSEPLLELKISHEQAAMVVGLGLGMMGRKMREKKKEENEEERRKREEVVERLSRHERRRVRGIAARMRDEWNGERRREEKGALIYL